MTSPDKSIKNGSDREPSAFPESCLKKPEFYLIII